MADKISTKLIVLSAFPKDDGCALACAFRTVIAAVISTCLMTSAMAAECPIEKSEYSLDLSDGETSVVFSQGKSSQPGSGWDVRFDVKRQETTVWSLSGFISCVKWTQSCYLGLDRKPEQKNDAHANVTGEDEKLCSEQQIFVVPITENNKEKYLAFGGLNFLSMVCGKYFDLKVKSKSNLSDEERDGMFALPEYVKLQGCRP
ncbi:hypothetical protein OIU34_37860 [Pararhizobium sp. BT-229]|uniref:hypothetical protein n=1 Tax=Pararhizobium sp. BT-229 TaxID=2986923 RepID=UPI0021F7E9A6|nr:hypothetical protein [Pararhizobium sp. BT-229]MCV9967595.1 hypothetical protein [Pararhizobium sp. BT-229]